MKTKLTVLGSALIVAASALATYCVVVEPTWLSITRLRIAMPDLPPQWDGLRIAHLSDFHAGGPRVKHPFLQQTKEAALAFQPDIVALTGDYYDNGSIAQVDDLYSSWPADIPVVAVTGNHDHRAGPARYNALLAELSAGGVTVLENQAVRLTIRGREAWIVGVGDPFTRRDRVDEAFAEVGPDADVLLFLAHSPSVVESLPVRVARLALAGHTHGGQVRLDPRGKLPFIRQIRRLKGLPPQPELPVAHGWHIRRGIPTNISNGIGVSSLPIRFRTRPQAIVIEMVAAPSDGTLEIQDVSDEGWLARFMR